MFLDTFRLLACAISIFQKLCSLPLIWNTDDWNRAEIQYWHIEYCFMKLPFCSIFFNAKTNFLLKGVVADFEVYLKIQSADGVIIIHQKYSGHGHWLSGKPLYFRRGNHKKVPFGETTKKYQLGKPQKSTTYVQDLSSYWSKTMFLVPFKNGWTDSAKQNVTFLRFPQNVTFLRFPQMLLFWGFPKGNKGVFRTTGDRSRNFFLRIMDTPWVL